METTDEKRLFDTEISLRLNQTIEILVLTEEDCVDFSDEKEKENCQS